MGLFERIRQSEKEEVELQPDRAERLEPARGSTESEGEDEPEEFLLPGMETEPEDDPEEKRRSTRSRRSESPSRNRSATNGEEASLEQIAAQNERIIELLEQLVDADGDEDPAVPW